MKRILYLHSAQPLQALGEACFSLTPKIYLPTPNDLYLEISTTEKVLGGEKNILKAFESLMGSFEIEGLISLSDSINWAVMLLRKDRVSLQPKGDFNHIKNLSINTLQYCGRPLAIKEEKTPREKMIAFMRRVGIYTIGDFLKLNPQSINRRFGKLGVSLFETLTGMKGEYFVPLMPQVSLTEEIEAEDIYGYDSLLFSLRKIFIKIEARLNGLGKLAKSIQFSLYLENNSTIEKTLLLTEPERETNALLKTVQEALRDLKWDSPLQHFKVHISETVPYLTGQLSLWDKTENKQVDLEKFIQRIKGQYQGSSIGFPELLESYLPEKSYSLVLKRKKFNRPTAHPNRPLFLFSTPKHFFPSPNIGLTPSEVIATEWWEKQGARKYFIAETPKERLWVFWDSIKQQWFSHGSFT